MATAKQIIEKAASYIGTKESPPNSNNVKFNTWFYGKQVSGSGYPWCCAFVCYVFNQCDALGLFCGGQKVAYCPTVENYYKQKGKYFSNTKGEPGDICLMDFGKGRASHIGIVEKKNSDGSYTIIEGNTSTTSNDNGGCVMRRYRYIGCIRGFARPDYSKSSPSNSMSNKTNTDKTKKSTIASVPPNLKKGSMGKEVGILQKNLNDVLGLNLSVDNDFGTKTFNAMQKFQHKYGLTVDGIYGKDCMNKMKALLK